MIALSYGFDVYIERSVKREFLRRLFHLQHQALEVFALGMVDVDGVVGGLVELVEDADVATALGGCGEDG